MLWIFAQGHLAAAQDRFPGADPGKQALRADLRRVLRGKTNPQTHSAAGMIHS